MNEEITVRFDADTSRVDRAFRSMKASAADAGESTHKSFVHAGNGAREFHKLLHSITEESPILGTALKAAFSPIGAALSGSLLIYKAAKDYIDTLNRRSDALEAGTDKPIINIKDALRDARKALMDFDREMEKFHRGQNKTASEKLTENLHEQLSLLDRQVAAAEKLSAKDKERLEHQKLLVTHGLQGRALFALNAQKTAAQTQLSAAEAAEKALLASPSIQRAQGLIGADEQFIATKQNDLKGLPPLEDSFLLDAITFMDRPQLERKRAERRQVEEEIKAAQKRIEQNKESLLREQEARKNASDRTAAARSIVTGAGSAFDAMSMSIEQTRAAIVTSGGWGAGVPGDSPNQRVANYLSKSQSDLHDWNVKHGVPDMMSGVATAKSLSDPTSKNIEELNAMFRSIIDPGSGMRVNFEIKDD